MRARYLEAFDRIWIDNLHGDRIISERNPEGESSQTVFAIQGQSPGIRVGTAVFILCRVDDISGTALRYRDFHQADADERRAALLNSLSDAKRNEGYTKLDPSPDLGLPFKPRTTATDYMDWPTAPELFTQAFPGIQSGRSDVVVDIDRDHLEDRMRAYFNPDVSHDEMEEIEPRAMESTGRFEAEKTREYLIQRGFKPENIVRYCYRPMDVRWLYWEPETKLLDEKRADAVQHIFEGNLWLSTAKSHRKGFDPPLVSTIHTARHVLERGAHLFPLKLNP